jgi:hypothetical protein
MVLLSALLFGAGAAMAASQSGAAHSGHATYSNDEVVKAATDFFATGAEGLGKVLGKVLKEKGQPVAFIRGREGGGAIGFGLRYGDGELVYKGGQAQKVYWQGPSLGFDFGGNAVKVFALVYNLPAAEQLYQRFPGVEGSLYFIGGFGANYVQSGGIVIAPVRFGVGWRQGIGVSYMHFSANKRLNPF